MAENVLENADTPDNFNFDNASVITLLDTKLNELKTALIKEFKAEIKTLVDAHKEEVVKLNSTVSMLQEHVSYLKRDNIILSKQCDENEQYGRRLCLRIEGVPVASSGKESADDVLNIIKNLITEADVEIPPVVLDRAHRIGKPQHPKESGKPITQSIIARFSTFRHRTLLYRARKTIKSARVRLDLTKARYGVLIEARRITDEDNRIKFVYSDINCRLKVRPLHGDDVVFENIENLEDILSRLS